jgi:TonB family protein
MFPARSRSIFISLAGHGAAFVGLMYAPTIQIPQREKSEYKLAIEGKEDKLVWYKFEKELPRVTPPKPKADRRPVKAENIAKQEIVAAPKAAPKRAQIVVSQAPAIDLPPLESPNLIAVRMPAKTFVAPPDIIKPKPEVQVPDAPPLDPLAPKPVDLDTRAKFVKQFVAPPTKVPATLRDVAIPNDAPPLIASLTSPDALDYKMKSPSRPFTAPPSRTTNAAVSIPEMPDVAVVGLNPSMNPAQLPTMSSPAQFSAAPKLRKEGAESAGDGGGITVPDLSVRGPEDLKAQLRAAYAAPTSTSNMREAMRLARGLPVDPIPVSPRAPGATKVSGAPDPRLNDRDVYMMAIQMPNLTSYSGSWLMWYADRNARERGQAAIAPPVAHRKVDPKYIAAAAADRIEGKVVLACVIGKDGHVSNIEIVKGLEDRLNASAGEAMSKWEFDPATRDGEPVAVDVLVEIPFRLEPHKVVTY